MKPASSDRTRFPRALALASVMLAWGCAEASRSPTDLEPSAELVGIPGGVGEGWDLPLLAPGQLTRAFPGSPCMDAAHQEFDFWVGDWNVSNTSDVMIGTNSVTSELDGCLVQEHWTANSGSRGRSLNTYDSETGLWNQTWVSQAPGAIFGRLRTSGGIVDGTMELTGVRKATGGFTFLDTWTWEENDLGQVIQTALAFVPEFNLPFPFTGIYTRGDITPAPPSPDPACRAGTDGGETREADFLVGTWDVSAENGPHVGSSSIETDLNGCVFVETFESVGGLTAVSFTYVDLWVERWFRTYVDSEGERLELEGGFEGGALVLRGTEDTAAGPVEVSVTWQPDGNTVRQTWEVSRDGGTTWQETVTLVYASP